MMVLLDTIETAFLVAFRDQDLFFGLGEGLTSWDIDGLPDPGVDLFELEAPLAYKRIRDKRFVVADAGGAIIVKDALDVDHTFTISEIPTGKLYLAVLFDNAELPTATFRERSIVSGLVLPAEAAPGQDFFLAAEVSGGTTLAYETHAPIVRHILIQEKFTEVIEFT